MRFVVLLLLASLSATAAEREQFTLKDGRVLVGTYDEATQTLNIDSPKASMHVDAQDIAKREEAPAADPAATIHKAAPATPNNLPAKYAMLLAQKQKADALKSQAEAAQDDYGKQRYAALNDFFCHEADLTPIPVKVPDNPTGAQLSEAHSLTAFNDSLKEAAEWLANDALKAKLKTSSIEDRKKLPKYRSEMPYPFDRDFIEAYAKRKHAMWLLDL